MNNQNQQLQQTRKKHQQQMTHRMSLIDRKRN